MEQVTARLQELYTNPDVQAKQNANQWLQDFQKEQSAWSTAGQILATLEAPLEPKLFAAQTFKTKVTYDLHDLSPQDRNALRDSLLAALQSNAAAPRALVTAISAALSDLLLQMEDWHQPVQAVSQALGTNPDTASALLEFLTVLAEEAAGNGRIEVLNNEVLTEETGGAVINLLSTYLQAPGTTERMHKQALLCLAAWLRSGGLMPEQVAGTPLFDASFQALQSDQLFDEAVSILTDLIHETQEIEEHVQVIQDIVPRLIPLQTAVSAAQDDPDKVKGYTKILAEAGQWYAPLVTRHQDFFLPIVQALLECAKCDDVEVVSLTFEFWYKLAKELKKIPNDQRPAPFLEVYAKLVDVILNLMRFPDDWASLTAQEKDDFRDFRHNVGDTLKDCCIVLGPNACLKRALDAVTQEMGKSGDASWQTIEAPLFAMRSMGALVDPKDDQVLPPIMEALPKLPNHPRIRYAATLVIGRYTEWTNEHPQHIPFQLDYLSNGFGDADTQVWLAAASAIKHLCQDCQRHMVVYLPQLHSFLNEVGSRLPPDDLFQITEGIAHIIRPMQPQEGINALSLFAHPILEQVVRLSTTQQLEAGQLRIMADAIERLGLMASICIDFASALPQTCADTATEAWRMLDGVLSKHGNVRSVSDVTCKLIRVGVDFFGPLAHPLAPAIIERLTQAWTLTNLSSYMWATAKFAKVLPQSCPSSDPVYKALSQAFDQQTRHVSEFLSNNQMSRNEDVVEDYLILLENLMHYASEIVVLSPHLASTLAFISSALGSVNAQVVRRCVDYILSLLGHDSLSSSVSAEATQQATAIRTAVQTTGFNWVAAMLNGMITDYEDTATCVTAFRQLGDQFPGELAQWVPAALQQVSPKALVPSEREAFSAQFNQAITARDLSQIRASFMALDRMSRKSKRRQWEEDRERRKMGMPDLVPAQ